MWGLELLGALAIVAVALALGAGRLELLFLSWYEGEVSKLDIVERANETIVTYPLA